MKANHSKPSPTPVKLRCQTCDGVLTVDESRSVLTCPYCGSKELIPESDFVKIERVRGQTQLQLEKQRQEFAEKSAAEQDRRDQVSSFKSSVLSKLLLALFVICSVLCFAKFRQHVFLLGFIALIQALLFLTSWLMGMGIIKGKPHMHLLPAILGLACVFLFISVSRSISDSAEKAERDAPYSWPNTVLTQQLPHPDSSSGIVKVSSDSSFVLEVHNVPQVQFAEYIESCKENGFTVEPTSSACEYDAFNENGFSLKLLYFPSDKEMWISLDAPRKMTYFVWPKSDLASLVPVPESLYGQIIKDRSDSFSVYIGNFSKEQFYDYIDACWDAGFSNNYSRNDTSFSAENDAGYSIQVEYEGFSTVYLSLKAPKEDPSPTPEPEESLSVEETAVPTQAPTDTSDSPEDESGISFVDSDYSLVTPEFKEFMDSYEAFIDSYIELMEKYQQNPYDPSLIMQYTEYLGKYAEFTEKYDAIDEKTLSPADDAYYILVSARIEQKLLKYSLLNP